jgi:hypothetical protein
MSERKASVFVCDDFFYNLTGKVTLSGMYTTNDIAIAGDEQRAAQLVFVFSIETPVEDPFTAPVFLRVSFPGNEPNILAVTVPSQNSVLFSDPARKTIVAKQPFLIMQPLLKPGRVETAVVHDKGEINAGDIWIRPIIASTATLN